MRPTMQHRGLALAAAVALALTGCGGDDGTVPAGNDGDAGGDAGGAVVTLSAIDNSFNPSELSVQAGQVTVTFTNDGQNPHTFTSDSLGFDTGTVDPGGSETVTFTAPDAATEFVCSIHGGGGMTGEIVPQ